MKIAIMTQPLSHNYGGIMQAWALQQILKRKGHEVITIDLRSGDKNFLQFGIRLGYRTAMKILGKRKAPINLEKHYSFIFQNTRRFIAQNITMSEPLNTLEKLKAYFEHEQFNVVIVGSDQTWRPKYSSNIENFFLDFLQDCDIKRIAYAASFGVDDWEFTEKETLRCSELVKLFSAVSVRELSGIQLCKTYLGVEATHVLDPTLLLEKNDYEQLIGLDRLNKAGQGIYTYFLDKTPDKILLVNKACKLLQEKSYSCQAKYEANAYSSSKVNDLLMPDLCDWLAGFANARVVLTDSFHGMIFSIIFEKPFYIIMNSKRGGSRFHSLLELLGCTDRIIYDSSDCLFSKEELHKRLSFDADKLKQIFSISSKFIDI